MSGLLNVVSIALCVFLGNFGINLMKKSFLFLIPFLAACSTGSSFYLPSTKSAQSDAEIAARRANVRALEADDYQIERKKRQDSIEDLGTLEMNRAKAINKAYENRSKQNIYIVR